MSQPPVARSVSRRISGTLFVTQSLFGAAQIASFTLIPIVAAQLSGGESLAGLPLTITFLARAASAYPFGWLMDRVGRRSGLSLGYLCMVIGAVISVLAIGWASFPGFCLGAWFAGMGRSASEQTRYVAAEAYPIEQRARVIGLIVFAGTVGAIGGPLIVAPSGELVMTLGLHAYAGPFFMAVVLNAVGVFLTFALLRPDPLVLARRHASTNVLKTADSTERGLREIFADPTVRYATAAMVIGQLVMTLLMVITPLHMNHHDHSTQSISLVIMVHAMGMFGFSSVTGRFIRRWGRHTVIRLGVLALALSSILTPVSPRFVPMAAALFLLGYGWNLCFIAGSSLLTDALAPQEKGRVQGANEMLIAFTASAGSISTGVAFGQGGIIAVGGIGLVLSGLLGVYSLYYARRMA